MNLVLLVHTGFIQANLGFFHPMLYITTLPSKVSFHCFTICRTHPFFWTLGLHFHGPDITQKTSPCKRTLVLLGSTVPQLSCSSQASVSSESTILSFLSWRPTDSSTAILLPSLDTGCKLWQRIHSTALCLVTIGVSASSAQPSHSLRPAATSTGVPSARPSRCLHLAAFNREFHQHALLTASPCSLQRTLGTPTPFLAVAYGHDSCIFQA